MGDERLSAKDVDMSWNRDDLDHLNALARIFYALRGYVVPDGFDFSAAKHPHEKEAFCAAAAAVNYVRDNGIE